MRVYYLAFIFISIYTLIFCISLCSIILFELLLTLFCQIIMYIHIPLMNGMRVIKICSVLVVIVNRLICFVKAVSRL